MDKGRHAADSSSRDDYSGFMGVNDTIVHS